MSDLADLAADVTGDMPIQVCKTINAALENGWELNKPGMTLCLRLNHPSDELAEPVYVTWVVGRTPTGKLSFRFDSCGTRGLVPLKGVDLLEYLADPTVVYLTDDDIAEGDAEATRKATEDAPPWNDSRPQMENLNATIGATVVKVERTPRGSVSRPQASKQPARALRVQAPALRVQAPKA